MAKPVKSKKRKKIKYRKVAFKVSDKQKDLIERCSRINQITPNKLVKTAIKDYLLKNADKLKADAEIGENQLKLFDIEDAFDNQLEMSDVYDDFFIEIETDEEENDDE